MLDDFDRVITYSRGIMKHRALNYFIGDRLIYAPRKYGTNDCVIGWGNKKNTIKARHTATKHNIPYFSLEDGFIRSVGLGVKGALAFSLIVDDLGMYYDATKPSGLENILTQYDFVGDKNLMHNAEQAISLVRNFKISKYNFASEITEFDIAQNASKKILVIAQTAGDMSLEYGYGNRFTTNDLLDAAIHENPGAEVYLKLHPDVIAGKKRSDITLSQVPTTCKLITRDIHPVSLLEKVDKVYTKTSQMGFEALLLGKECVCFGLPFYAGWGLTDDRVKCPRRIRKLTVSQVFAGAYILYSHYYNPYLDKKSDIIDTLYTLKRYKDIERVNGSALLFHGFPPWKQLYHRHFFKSCHRNSLTFCSSTKKITAQAGQNNARLLVWSKPDNPDTRKYLESTPLPTYSVEDGFIRSVALGSNLTMPYSLVVDARGLYIDPSQESDLEHILNTYNFQAHTGLLERAGKVAEYIVNAKLSKYNFAPHGDLAIDRHNHDKAILIPGQVSDDASIRLGGLGMNNLNLVKKVRENNPHSYLIFKPHPDVVAGNRNGNLPASQVLQYCNSIITDASIDTCINSVDEVHTITSLSGFDAIIRNKKVCTYGLPFYAGWGLTEDLYKCSRRNRFLSKEELVAGALLLYPRYIHPVTKEFCEVEQVLKAITREQAKYTDSVTYRQLKKLRNSTLTASRQLFARFKKTDEQ